MSNYAENDMSWSESGGGNYEQASEGLHLARCIAVVDLGTQEGEYEGKKTTPRKNIIIWEIVDEMDTEGRPFTIKKFYTASLNENAALRKDLQAWRGRAFTPEELKKFRVAHIINAPVQLSLQKNDKGKIAVKGMLGVGKNTQVPAALNEPYIFSLDGDKYNESQYQGLPDWMKKYIMLSPEYAERQYEQGGVVAANMPTADADANLPF